MRSPLFVILFLVVAIGYYGYREGYLASLHPSLDPGAESEVEEAEEEQDDSPTPEEEEEEAGAPGAREAAKSKAKEQAEAKAAALAERQRIKAEKAEADKLARQGREAQRAAEAEALAARRLARDENNRRVNGEVDALNLKWEGLMDQLRTAQNNLDNQERTWREEKIKTREPEKQKLREASNAFQDGLRQQMKEVELQIKAKRRELQ